MTENYQIFDELPLECDRCGGAIYDLADCRVIDGNVLCVECLREMRTCEILEVLGISYEEYLYDYLGLSSNVRCENDNEREGVWFIGN